ncbi:hypothetical protein SAMN05444161_7509 [Rhizobiales bacterium GAS191]|nr:hypothetical protein SAMN05444161_7509 [Rhizobiales bacterium GAS191]
MSAANFRTLLDVALLTTILLPGRTTATEAFTSCEEQAIRDLDDGISSADVIAAGVVQECLARNPLKHCDARCGAAMVKYLSVQVLPNVLKFRATKHGAKPNG